MNDWMRSLIWVSTWLDMEDSLERERWNRRDDRSEALLLERFEVIPPFNESRKPAASGVAAMTTEHAKAPDGEDPLKKPAALQCPSTKSTRFCAPPFRFSIPSPYPPM